ncbi:MAG TPA: hypothetical protein PKX10_02145 [Propioniciclava tarda]|nr:hypothetical protein [Propioniciclava tarda]HQD59918.1 hypothetical protein [Propioniciclava tarda]
MTAGRPRLTVAGLVGLGVLSAASLGGLVALSVAQPAIPQSLGTAPAASDIEVTSEPFDDARTVQLTLVSGAPRSLAAPSAGTLTQFDCAAGGVLTSGTSPLAIDGTRILVLATAVPLWRDLPTGAKGDDVRALQQELKRLGQDPSSDGDAVGPATLRAFAKLRDASGGSTASSISLAQVAWIPEPSTSVTSCTGAVGQRVTLGEALASLPPRLSGLKLTAMPGRLVDGLRTLKIGDVTAAVTAVGAVTDPETLSKIAATPAFAAAASDPSKAALVGQYALAQPITISVLPASAVSGAAGAQCVFGDDRTAVGVSVVGSQLGQSYVTFTGDAPTRVLITPPEGARCASR